jgi:hypothetical protein
MPDLTMSFVNPRLFDDVSFHPCVRWYIVQKKKFNRLWGYTCQKRFHFLHTTILTMRAAEKTKIKFRS